MDMMSPELYMKQQEKCTTEELLQKKKSLQESLIKMQKDIDNNVPDIFNGGRITRYKMYQEYLQKIEEILSKRDSKN